MPDAPGRSSVSTCLLIFSVSIILCCFFPPHHRHFPPQTAIKISNGKPKHSQGRLRLGFNSSGPRCLNTTKTHGDAREGGDPVTTSLWVSPPSPGLSGNLKKERTKEKKTLGEALFMELILYSTPQGRKGAPGRANEGRGPTVVTAASITLSLKGYQK